MTADAVPTAGAVGLLVDGSVAAIAAAGWAARIAGEKRTSLLVVVLVPYVQTQDKDAAAALARVQPALDRAGRPWSVQVCRYSGGMNAGRRLRRTERQVRAVLPTDLSLLVCPGGAGTLGQHLSARLATRRTVDLLVVPDLSSVSDARAVHLPPACDSPQPGEASPCSS